jgi:hypothetical protein
LRYRWVEIPLFFPVVQVDDDIHASWQTRRVAATAMRLFLPPVIVLFVCSIAILTCPVPRIVGGQVNDVVILAQINSDAILVPRQVHRC